MKGFVLPVAVLALAGGQELTTNYAHEETLAIEIESSFVLETTDFSMERDGEPVEGGFGGGRGPTSQTRSVSLRDTILEHEDGAPTKVRREFAPPSRPSPSALSATRRWRMSSSVRWTAWSSN